MCDNPILQIHDIYFDLFFDREELLKKGVLHYKPCPLTSLSSRKNWDIFAFSSEKIDFFIFACTNFRGHLKKFPLFFWLGSPLWAKMDQIFSSTRYNNSYTNRKPFSSLVEICCFQIFLSDFWPKKAEKQCKNRSFEMTFWNFMFWALK